MITPLVLPEGFDISLLKSVLYELTNDFKSFGRSTTYTDCPKPYRQLVDMYLHEAGITILEKYSFGATSIKYKLHHPQTLNMTVDDFCKVVLESLYKQRIAQLLKDSEPKTPANRTAITTTSSIKPSIDKYLFISLIALNAIQFVIILTLIFGVKS